MRDFGLIARFPLGVFQGRGADGSSRDPFPDVYRLQGALTQAAGKGSTAIVKDGDLRPSATALAALTWLDSHPADAIEVPATVAAHSGRRELASYRAEGVFERKGEALIEKKRRPDLRNRIAFGGRVGWLWRNVPDDVADTLNELSADVSCLGEADSPVVLESGDVQPTHHRTVGATQFGSTKGLRVGCPTPGTTSAREAQYEADRPRKQPSVASDKFSLTQMPSSSPVVQRRRVEVYERPRAEPPATPWKRALIFGSSVDLPEERRVAWCVAFHRLITARSGDDAPPIITGVYPQGTPRPANRVAIQALDASLARHVGCDGPAFAVLIPREMNSQELSRLNSALSGRLRVWSGWGEAHLTPLVEVSADEFWAPPKEGASRLWVPVPGLVSETRRQPDENGERWTLRHAALLSLAFVFKDSLALGAERRPYWALSRAAEAEGVRVFNPRRIADSHVERYAYKYPPDAVVQPFSALIDIGRLAGPCTVLAVGQARHVGGGLLVPLDVDDRIARESKS